MVYKIAKTLTSRKGRETLFNDGGEILAYIKAGGRDSYEIIEHNVIPYFDYEVYYIDDEERKQKFKSDIDRVRSELNKCYPKPAKFYWFTSSGLDTDRQSAGKPCYKNSIHVLIRGAGYYALPSLIPKPECGSHDNTVYKKYQKFRMAFCSKTGQHRFKNRYDPDTGVSYDINEFGSLGESYAEYMITNVEGEQLVTEAAAVAKVKSSYSLADVISGDPNDPIDSDSDSEENIELSNTSHTSDSHKYFNNGKHFRGLLKCLKLDRITGLDNWLLTMRICKNIAVTFPGDDKLAAFAMIHIFMKTEPTYKEDEVNRFLNESTSDELAIPATWGSLAMMAREDNPTIYSDVIAGATRIKSDDIFNSRRLDELRSEPRRYYFSDFNKFNGTRMKDPVELLKFFVDTSSYVFNRGQGIYVIFDRSIKPADSSNKTEYKYVYDTRKKNPFTEAKHMCKFKLYDTKYDILEFSKLFFNKFYYTYSEMVPYAGAIDPLLKEFDRVLNKFEGFENAKLPPVDAPYDKMLWHIKHIICNANEEVYDYVLSWIADILQNPGRKCEVSLLLEGVEGCGKNRFIEIIKALVGSKHCFDTSDINDIVGGFNVHLSGKLLVVGDEMVGFASYKVCDRLKSAQTSSYINITKKGYDTIQESSHHRYAYTTNNKQSFRLTEHDRRILALLAAIMKVGNRVYFKSLSEEIDSSDSIKALFDYLSARDLSSWNFRNIPSTELKRSMISQQQDNIIHWFLEYLETDGNGAGLCVIGDTLRIKAMVAHESYLKYDTSSRILRNVFKTKITDLLKCRSKRFTAGQAFVFDVSLTNVLLTRLMGLTEAPIPTTPTATPPGSPIRTPPQSPRLSSGLPSLILS
jgi:hypothetical protein